MNTELMSLLKKALKENEILLSEVAIDKCVAYLQLLQKWNKHYNLTAITDPHEQVLKHIIDSLSIREALHGDHILDVGSGAGFPGIPLAIVETSRHFTLLDSNGKKTRFLTHVKQALQLKNVSIVNDRIESYQPNMPFDSILTRAFGKLCDMLSKSRHCLAAGGLFLAMKADKVESELQMVQAPFEVIEIKSIKIKGLEAERRLVVLSVGK